MDRCVEIELPFPEAPAAPPAKAAAAKVAFLGLSPAPTPSTAAIDVIIAIRSRPFATPLPISVVLSRRFFAVFLGPFFMPFGVVHPLVPMRLA